MTTDLFDPAARSSSPAATRGGGLFASRRVRICLGVFLVVGVGVGAFLLSSSLSSPSVSPVGTVRRPPVEGGGQGPGRFGIPGSGQAGTRPIAVGTVGSVASKSFTITSRTGATVTVNVSSSTTYVGVAGLSAVKVGDRVVVVGTAATGKAIAATRVLVGVGGRGFGRNGGFGGNGPGGGNPGFGGNGVGGNAPAGNAKSA